MLSATRTMNTTTDVIVIGLGAMREPMAAMGQVRPAALVAVYGQVEPVTSQVTRLNS
jgi:hypothetical protein